MRKMDDYFFFLLKNGFFLSGYKQTFNCSSFHYISVAISLYFLMLFEFIKDLFVMLYEIILDI